ncbi:MAG: tRNA-dihydrouridine synthase family protein, partial [Candidatus Bathyarchaeota archaeon]|nr:tRNA-dihydrouridine synthase family protein [Candidatus Bathyarchaeota archaeon]
LEFMLAPLERYTDSVFRTLCHNHGADLTFTEMAHVESFLNRNRGSLEKIKIRDSTPVQIQILSGNEGKLNRFLTDFKPFDGFKGFNLNLSCPSRDVIRQGKGAAMVKRGAKTARLVSLIRDYGYPVSVKIRLGLNRKEKANKIYLNNLRGVDPDFFVVHAKHAAQGSDAKEDNSVYPECVEAARGIPVVANGSIETPKMVQTLIKMGVSGVMMGRPALRNSAIFDYLKNELGVNDPPKQVPTIGDLMREYDDIYAEIRGSETFRSRFLKVVGKTHPRY